MQRRLLQESAKDGFWEAVSVLALNAILLFSWPWRLAPTSNPHFMGKVVLLPFLLEATTGAMLIGPISPSVRIPQAGILLWSFSCIHLNLLRCRLFKITCWTFNLQTGLNAHFEAPKSDVTT